MNIYSKKQRWKLALAAVAAVIVFASLWYTSILVRDIAAVERSKAKSWADAIQRKAALVSYTQDLFEKISVEERKKVEIWAEANRGLATAPDDNLGIYTKILFSNTTIPMVLTDADGKIITYRNLKQKETKDSLYVQQRLEEMKGENDPVVINYFGDQRNLIYYGESTIFAELRRVLQEQVESFNKDIITNLASAPVIYTDSSQHRVLAYGNIDKNKKVGS